MKKLLVFAFAAMGMVACVKEEVALLPKGDAICFENAFIDNATRAAVDPSITTATLSGFNVWGFVKEYDGEIFNGVEVTKTNDVWGYEGTQYWVPNQPYYFAALAPMNSANWRVVSKATGEEAKKGLGLVYFENVNGSEDLLYAKDMVTSKGLNEDNGSVKFQFQHLLSKVKFTFKNGFPTETASIKVTNVKMTTPDSGEIDLANIENGWSLDGADLEGTTLEFGDVEKLAYAKSAEVAQERLTIPASADQCYTITFDVELFMGAQSVYEVSKTSVVTGHELAMGNAYNFVAEINPTNLELDEIEFEVEGVDSWVPEGGQQIDVAVAELKAAAAQGGAYTLYKDITLTEPLAVKGDLNINLNGKKLQYTEDDRMFKVYGATLTIDGEGVVEVNSDNLSATTTAAYIGTAYDGAKIIINGGVHKTNGCTAYHTNGGKVEINGGEIIADETGYTPVGKYNYTYVLNVQGGTVSTARNFIEVKGGRFYKFNPQNNAAEGAGTNFLADGCSIITDGDYYVVVAGDVIAGTQDDFNAAIADSEIDDIYLEGGNYSMPAVSNQNLTINGTEDVVITVNKPAMHGSDLTFNGVTIKGSGYNTGVQHVNSVTYNNAKIIGEMCLYGEKVVFNNCTFELGNGQYIWVYGAKEAEFHNCVFNTAGKALLIYNEGAGANNVVVEGCTFNATAGAKAGAIANQNCAAIEIDNFQSSGVGAAHTLTTSNNTFGANFSGEWRIKNYVAGGAITVNGVAYTRIAIDGKFMSIDAGKNVTILF